VTGRRREIKKEISKERKRETNRGREEETKKEKGRERGTETETKTKREIRPDLGTCTVRVCVSVTTLGTWTSIVRSSYVITGTCSSNESDR
jgi:hypothetical protein